MMFRDQSADSKTKYLQNQLAGQRHGHGIAGDSEIQIKSNDHKNGETSEAIRRVITDLRSMCEANESTNHHEARQKLFSNLNVPDPVPDPEKGVTITADSVVIEMTATDAIHRAAALADCKRSNSCAVQTNNITSQIVIGQFTQINS
jgi:hypothetical protein